jgi:hypothetical protein
LSDHRQDLVVQRIRIPYQIRWYLPELDPDLLVSTVASVAVGWLAELAP